MTEIVIIFPARNEEKTITACIETAMNSAYKPSVIVVDGHSNDKTREVAEKSGATVVTQNKRVYPGKGIAMVTGIRAAIQRKPDVILFLDADITNLTPEWVNKLINAVVDGRSDMARGYYQRRPRDAPVTKLIGRPMLSVFFPELSHFEQPLSGEVCARREVWELMLKKDPPEGWGVDIWFLIECAMQGYNITEVFLGKKEHSSLAEYQEDVVKLRKMAEQVCFTIINEAIKHNRISRATEVSM